ncbi:TraC family protein [Thermodesulfobacteriota bacterium B35]
MFAQFLQRVLLGPRYDDSMKYSDLAKMTRRQPFSAFLNYLAYDPDLEIYLNQDGTLGMLWECTPLVFAGVKTMTALEGLFRAGLPDGSVIQFILHADSRIEPTLENYRQRRTRQDPIVQAAADTVVEFLKKGKKGLEQCAGIPVRNFRSFVAVKIPGDSPDLPGFDELQDREKVAPLLDIKRHIRETLKAASLMPEHMAPAQLLEWCRRFFNHYPDGYPERNFDAYNPDIPIRKQIINADTVIREEKDHLRVGGKRVFITTPKSIPRHVDPLQTNSLFGGIWGVASENEQIRTDFLCCLNIFLEPGLKMKIHGKCNLLLNQHGVGSFSTSLQRRQQEYLEATDDLEEGKKFVKIIPVMMVWSEDLEKARDSLANVRKIWEGNGYVMQQDKLILKIMFLSALPFCLYTTGKNLETLERDFIASTQSVAPLIPVQGDFEGTGEPALPFIGRKGELVAIDFFGRGSINQNVLCCATTGAGKSFLVNFIAFNYYACNALVRIIDIGGSYKKMTNMLGARYLDFDEGTDVCLNPFTYIREPDEELKSVVPVFAQMAHANTDATGDDTEINLIRTAIQWAWDQKGNKADVDTVYEFLVRFPDAPGAGLQEMADNRQLVARARDLAFNIRAFTSKGPHGRFFVGDSTFDIKNDEFVVLELEHLKVQPDLYRVVTLLVINAVTQDLYLSDRSRPRLIIFDEAHQFLGKGGMIAPTIEEGYRRARKYNGSFMVITQSILDMELFGDAGMVITSNSAYKMFLESQDFEKAQARKLIDYDPFTMKLLKSVKSNPPRYSEIFFDTPFGTGVVRLAVNDYAYFIYTSKASEIAMIEQKVAEGKTYHEAILEMVELRRSGEL